MWQLEHLAKFVWWSDSGSWTAVQKQNYGMEPLGLN